MAIRRFIEKAVRTVKLNAELTERHVKNTDFRIEANPPSRYGEWSQELLDLINICLVRSDKHNKEVVWDGLTLRPYRVIDYFLPHIIIPHLRTKDDFLELIHALDLEIKRYERMVAKSSDANDQRYNREIRGKLIAIRKELAYGTNPQFAKARALLNAR